MPKQGDTNAVLIPVTPRDEDAYNLVGILYVAATDHPAPLAVMLHGIPGSEKHHDLAHVLRTAGWHVLVLHFGGAWGSGGRYNPLNHPREIRAALDYLLGESNPYPVLARKVALIGYSLGSRAAILAGAEDKRVGAVVSLAGISDFEEIILPDSFFESVSPILNGASLESLRSQFHAMGQTIQPSAAILNIAPRPVLVVHGVEDEVVPFYHADTLAHGAGEHVQRVTLPHANHTFAGHRPELIAAVTDFLYGWVKA